MAQTPLVVVENKLSIEQFSRMMKTMEREKYEDV